MMLESLLTNPAFETALRLTALGVGTAVFFHFAAMASACEGRHVPWPDAILIPCVAASGVGLIYVAASAPMCDMPAALLMTSLALTAFALRIWRLGFHVSAFLSQCTPQTPTQRTKP